MIGFGACFVLGVAAAIAWPFGWATLAPPVSVVLALLVFSPLAEELLRVATLGGATRIHPPETFNSVWSPLGYGLGFGLWEAIPRWMSIVAAGESRIAGPVSPLLLHVLLSVLIWRYLQRGRPLVGLSICVVLHAVYNTYVVLVVQNLGSFAALSLNDLVCIFILGNLLVYALKSQLRRQAQATVQ
jgi:hypothetical protein